MNAISSPPLISALQSLSAEVAEVVRREQDETQATYLFSDPLLISGVDMAGALRQPSINGAPPVIGWLPEPQHPSSVAPRVMKTQAFRNVLLYRSYFTAARLLDVRRSYRRKTSCNRGAWFEFRVTVSGEIMPSIMRLCDRLVSSNTAVRTLSETADRLQVIPSFAISATSATQ